MIRNPAGTIVAAFTRGAFARKAVLKHFAAVACLGAAILPAPAHHSTVMFDSDREVMLTGTVKRFQYTNPHSSIQILVAREGGQSIEWSIQTESPIVLEKAGIESTALRPGDQVSVRVHPLKDGRTGGWLIDVKKADGTRLIAPD